jgi:hypothetical protein
MPTDAHGVRDAVTALRVAAVTRAALTQRQARCSGGGGWSKEQRQRTRLTRRGGGGSPEMAADGEEGGGGGGCGILAVGAAPVI